MYLLRIVTTEATRYEKKCLVGIWWSTSTCLTRMSSTSIKAIDQTLEGVGIIEKDDHNDIIMTWYVGEGVSRRVG